MVDLKISIIVPIYNIADFLRECLDSIINQTMHGIEIICINDGSTDESPAILEEYAAKDDRIIIVNKENGGLNSALNAGLERVRTDYFAIVDGDDWIEPVHCEHAYARAVQSEADMTMFFWTFRGEWQNNPIISMNDISAEDKTESLEKLQAIVHNWQSCCCHLWKTEFVRRNKMKFHEELMTNTEIPFTYRGALLANKIAILKERLYNYRYRKNSLIHNANHPRFLQRGTSFNILWYDLKNDVVNQACRDKIIYQKLIQVYDTYNEEMAPQYIPEFRRRIRQELLPGEREISQKLPENIALFYSSIYGFLFTISCKFKRIKKCIADKLAKNLIPHAPWLQNFFNAVKRNKKRNEN